MKRNEISKLAQGEVMALMANGFTICLDELTGSYSDVEGTQVVFARGDERVVMWTEREHGSFSRKVLPQLVLKLARFTNTEGKNTDWGLHWPHEWDEHVYAEWVAYRIAEDWYTLDKAEAEACRQKSYERHDARYIPSFPRNVEITDDLWRIVKKVRGFKSAKRDDVEIKKDPNVNAWTFRNVKSGTSVYLCA